MQTFQQRDCIASGASISRLRNSETCSKAAAAGGQTAVQDTVKVKPLKADEAPMGAIYTKSKHSIDATHKPNQPVTGRQTDGQTDRQRPQTQNVNVFICQRFDF